MVIVALWLSIGTVHAQTALPVLGDTVWKYGHDVAVPRDGNPETGPRLAYAEDANLVFRIASKSHVIAIDGQTGAEHGRVNITELTQSSINVRPQKVSCSRDGRLLLVEYTIDDTFHLVLVSYPDKALVRTFPYTPSSNVRDAVYSVFSPDGRWVVAPANSNLRELHDLQRGTKEPLRRGLGDLAFSDASTELMFYQIDSVGGLHYTVMDLTTEGHPCRSVNAASESWRTLFSGNARYVLAWTGPGTFHRHPQATVFDLQTGDTVWQITGSYIPPDSQEVDLDMKNYAISGDGSIVFIYRDDTVAGRYLKGGYFYRLPDTIPFARSTIPGLVRGKNEMFSPVTQAGGIMLWSPDMRRCFASPEAGISIAHSYDVMAMRYDLTTGVDEPAPPELPTLVYPNPSTGTITLETPHSGPMSWSVWSTDGRRIDDGAGYAAAGRLTITLPPAIPAGRYMLSVHPAHDPDGRRTHLIEVTH
jgi:hypothetical protein